MLREADLLIVIFVFIGCLGCIHFATNDKKMYALGVLLLTCFILIGGLIRVRSEQSKYTEKAMTEYEEVSNIPTIETVNDGIYKVSGDFVGPGGKTIVIANREAMTSIDIEKREVVSVSVGPSTLIRFNYRPYRDPGTNGFHGFLVISTDPLGKKSVREFRISELGR